MVKQSPHKSWKGCALCKMHKHKGASFPKRTKFNVLRKVGAKRRLSRHAIPD